jgi:cyclophilin family peptidyl-prolyl cis-trans isomerase
MVPGRAASDRWQPLKESLMSFRALPLASLVLAAVSASAMPQDKANPVVEMKTSLGTVRIELFQDKAPITVKNFLGYVDDKFYDGTVFHRVIADFMIQGGGFDATDPISEKRTKSPIKNEADNGVKNERGTLAMARTNVVDSATAQFFINVKNNDFLNHREKSQRGYGYAVFGKVIEGMEVVDKIRAVETGSAAAVARDGERKQETVFQDVPKTKVVIESVRRVTAKK